MATPGEKEELFEQIFVQYRKRFLFFARQYAPPGEIMDLYQEILHQLWKSLDRFEGRSSPATWAYRVAMNTACAYHRDTLRRERSWRDCAEGASFEQQAGRGEGHILREFLRSLPDMERSIFTLYLTNLSYREIADVVGLSESVLRVKISRLKHLFEQRYL